MDAIEPGAQRTGALLAAAREAAGIDLVDLARESRVPLRHLKAIEADSHASLPALPYSVGFVKTFAKAVGLDPEAMASQFRSETSKLAHVPSVPSLEPLDERRVPSRGVVMASIAAIVLMIAALSAWGAGAFDPAPVADLSALPIIAMADPAPAVALPTPAPVLTGVAGTPVPAGLGGAPVGSAPIAAGGQVVLAAKEDVWIRVYDRSTRASAKIGILKAGETFAVPADPPGLMLWTGKAGALNVLVNGRPIPPLGGPVETVRDVSLAAGDLLARSAAPAAAPGA